MTRLASVARVVALAALLAGMWLALRHQPAGAQGRPSTAVALARVAVAEAGWDPSTGDAAAIAHLLVRRADRRGVSTRRMAELYSAGHFDPARRHRRWIVGLDGDARRPDGWPRSLPWTGGYRVRWLAMVDHVRGVLRGEVADPCPGAMHWGGPVDDWRAERAGWTRVECSAPTRNRFWRVPTRVGGAS